MTAETFQLFLLRSADPPCWISSSLCLCITDPAGEIVETRQRGEDEGSGWVMETFGVKDGCRGKEGKVCVDGCWKGCRRRTLEAEETVRAGEMAESSETRYP